MTTSYSYKTQSSENFPPNACFSYFSEFVDTSHIVSKKIGQSRLPPVSLILDPLVKIQAKFKSECFSSILSYSNMKLRHEMQLQKAMEFSK